MKRRSLAAGTTTVEFAIVGMVALFVLLACIETGRLLYTLNTLAEATRRAARIAAVCPPGDPSIARAALMQPAGGAGASRLIGGLTAANVDVAYLAFDGSPAPGIAETRYVRVSITGFLHTLLLPFVGGALPVAPFTTTLPTESLGWVPELGAHVCLAG